MKKLTVLILSVLLMLTLAGCKLTTVSSGTVISKEYCPPFTTVAMIFNGKTCFPVPIHHPPSYRITIRGLNEEGEEGTGTYSVTEYEYNNIEIGDYWEVHK